MTTTTPAWFIVGQILAQALSWVERGIHPVIIVSAYNDVLQTVFEIVSRISVPIDMSDDEQCSRSSS